MGLILTSVSSGGIAGFLIGYAIKKAIKVIMAIAGLFLCGLAYLNYQGVITVDWNKIASASNIAAAGFSNSNSTYASAINSQVIPTVMNFGAPLTGSFAAGFILGCLKG